MICVVVLLSVNWQQEAKNAQEAIARAAEENAGLVAIAESSDEEAPASGALPSYSCLQALQYDAIHWSFTGVRLCARLLSCRAEQ